MKASDRQSLPGIILVVIGLVLLVAQWFELRGAGVLAAIAAVFLTAYATSRTYGFLIRACSSAASRPVLLCTGGAVFQRSASPMRT